jgi:antitoxin component HigA of HigAB toxin-antitoxin module
MLTNKKHRKRQPGKLTSQKTGSIKAAVYHFPIVQGLEDVAAEMATVKAETLFSALLKGYDLSSITTEEQAKKAERFLEYLLRTFEKTCPQQVKTYLHLLEMLLEEYDKQHTLAAVKNIHPHKLLKTILEEDGLNQKSLVPSCFKSASQVSEFLSQKKGRERLTAQQAINLGKRFHLDPLLFLKEQ